MKSKIQFLLAFAMMFVMLGAFEALAQVPQLFNYQGIARDAKGNPLSNQKMSLKLSVLPTADATVAEYEETQLVNTNEFGLYTLQIGNGTAVTGNMKTVKWETGNKYIKVAIDPTGGNNYVDAGTNQLLSVPYAIYADKAGTAADGGNDKTRTGAVNSNAAHVAGDVNYLTKFTALNTIGKSLLFDNGTSVGLGTSTPSALARFHLFNSVGNAEFIRMQNTASTGFGKFIMYNDNASNYATFTKYGSAYVGGYPSIASQFPYANMLAFGNNLGPFLLANNGDVGIGIVTGGTTKLYFNARQSTGYLGIGGSFIPSANVHINNSATGDTLRITNATTGHLNTDGLEIRTTGNAASIFNRENSNISLGTNNADPNTFTITPNQLLYNVNSSPTVNDVIYLKPKSNGGSNWMTLQGTKANSYTFINMIDSGIGNKGTIFGQSSTLYGGTDSAGFIIYNPATHNTALGTYAAGGLILNNSNGKIGNGFWFSSMTGNAQLNINTGYDTAGHFTSNSTNGLFAGVLRGEYTGTTISDHVGVYGRSVPDPASFWGIGVLGEGGFRGVTGNSYITGGGNSGVQGFAASNGTAYGVNATADYVSSLGVGNKYGVYSYANGGANNYGVYGIVNSFGPGNGTGVYGLGKQTGVYGQADSASASQTFILGGISGYKEAIGVMGKANFITDGFTPSVSTGVVGSSKNTGYWNIGLYGEASDASYNIGVYGHNNGNVGFFNYAGFFVGDVNITGNLAKASGTFKIDHPQDPANKYLIHSFVESPDMMNVYNGNIVSDANGYATVSLPSYFEAENKDFKYQLTVLDNSADFVMAKVTKEVNNNTFEIRTSKPGVKVSWQVTGVRQDAYANAHRIVDVVDKAPEDKGYYIHPELFGAPSTQVVGPGKGKPNAERRLLPTPAEHQQQIEENKRIDLEHQQNQDNMKKNWKPQELPKSNNKPNLSK